jgi:hypothetical protein
MDLRFSPNRGIVEVMDEQHTRDRTQSLGSALQRLAEARERRGPVGVFDPFEVVPAQDRLAVAEMPRSMRRRGLFSFSDRARDAAG